MDNLLFGISGIPLADGNQKFNYINAIEYLSNHSLEAMELPFVRSVNVTSKNKDLILSAKNKHNFYLSAHGSYYINLNAKEEEKVLKSIERIEKGAQALKSVDGKSLVFHPGYYLGDSEIEAYNSILKNLLKLEDFGIDYRLETTGKGTQFGSLEEIVSLCKEVKTCKPCIDFSHIHARGNGALKDYADFARIFSYIGENLGEESLRDMHMHISGINYGPKGEKNHLPLQESDFNYKGFVLALLRYDIKGCLISESPLLEKDALFLKNLYESM